MPYRSTEPLSFRLAHYISPGPETTILYFPTIDRLLSLSTALADALTRYQFFTPAASMANDIASTTPALADQAASIHDAIRRLDKQGIFVGRSDLASHLRTTAPPSDPMPTTTFALITRDRPAAACRCLRSFAANHLQFNHQLRYIVFDDSTTTALRETLQEGLRGIARQFRLLLIYVGPNERRHYAQLLQRKLQIPAEVVKFSLFDIERCGYAAGINRNAALLSAVGEQVIMVDDDVVCDIADLPNADAGILLSTTGERRSTVFLRDQQAVDSVRLCNSDSYHAHIKYLGSHVGNILRLYRDDEITVTLLGSADVDRLLAFPNRIAVTASGLFGDCAIRPFEHYLIRGGSERDQLLQSASFYRASTRNRQLISTVTAPSITRGNLMAYYSAYDHRHLLPPFMPVCFDQDGLFARTLHMCFPTSWQCHIPLTVAHRPNEQRRFSSQSIGASYSTLQSAITHLIMAGYTDSGAGRYSTDSERLASLGDYLSHIGSTSLREYKALVTTLVWRHNANRLRRCEELLRHYNAEPSYWAADMRQAIRILRATIGDPDSALPNDLRRDRSTEETLSLSQRLQLRFGTLLLEWSDIVSAARRLKDDGVEMGRTL